MSRWLILCSSLQVSPSPLLQASFPRSPRLAPPIAPSITRGLPDNAPLPAPSDQYSNVFSSAERPNEVWAPVSESPRAPCSPRRVLYTVLYFSSCTPLCHLLWICLLAFSSSVLHPTHLFALKSSVLLPTHLFALGRVLLATRLPHSQLGLVQNIIAKNR